MSFYKSPIKPYDPVIEYDDPGRTIRYYRSEFQGTGQYSYPQPPSEPQDQWSNLYNVLPPITGAFYKRWGYTPFTSDLGFSPSRAADYANEGVSPVTRKAVFMDDTHICVVNDDGSLFVASLFTPSGTPYMVYSRSTAYFTDTVTSGKKWDGSQVDGVSNWGIAISNSYSPTSVTDTASPSVATNYAPGGGTPSNWTTGGSPVGSTWTSVLPSAPYSKDLQMTTCGFAITSTDPIVSIQADISYTISPAPTGASILAGFTRNGVRWGYQKAVYPATSGTVTVFGNNTVGLTASNINAADFGCFFQVTSPNSPAVTVTITAVTISVVHTTVGYGIQLGSPGSGSITLTSGRIYYYVFRNSVTAHMSDLSAPSASTGMLTSNNQPLSNIGVSTDPQVDVVWILATADGGDETTLYFLAEIPNGTTTYTDDTDELSLLANNVVLETDVNGIETGVAGNDPPPPGIVSVRHQGRIFIANAATLYCSKNLAELTTSTGLITGRFEEAWPTENQFDISDEAENITALISDGTTLYICTNRHIRRLTGDSPVDFQFQSIVFNEVGVDSIDAITVVYSGGNPAGAIWVTPDQRVIQSDFNTYEDIGAPVQNVFNSIPLQADVMSHLRVTFYSRGEFDLCVVAFTQSTFSSTWNNLWMVYDTRAMKWYTWQLFDNTKAMLFRFTADGQPQWLFADQNNLIHYFLPTLTHDNGNTIDSALTTPWLHFGSPTMRKWPNELEIITEDPGILVSVYGATNANDFLSPFTLVNGVTPVTSPLGDLKVFLATQSGHHRFYRVHLASSVATTAPILQALNFEIIPIHNL